jgi:hypothetical protein
MLDWMVFDSLHLNAQLHRFQELRLSEERADISLPVCTLMWRHITGGSSACSMTLATRLRARRRMCHDVMRAPLLLLPLPLLRLSLPHHRRHSLLSMTPALHPWTCTCPLCLCTHSTRHSSCCRFSSFPSSFRRRCSFDCIGLSSRRRRHRHAALLLLRGHPIQPRTVLRKEEPKNTKTTLCSLRYLVLFISVNKGQ